MIDFTGKNYAALREAMLARISSSYDKRDTSPIPTALGPAAYQIEGIYLTLDQMQRQAFIGTAVGEDLDKLAVIGGIERRPATAAVRLGVFNVPINLGARFSTVNGAKSIDFVATAATSNDLEWWLTAEEAGNIGNEYTGPILPITTIPNLTSAVISDIVIDGSDVESDDSLRSRLIDSLTERPFGGNIASYRKNLLELTEVINSDGEKVAVSIGGVQVYPTWNGGGTVKCSIVGADMLPASSDLVDLIQYAVDPPAASGLGVGFAPIGAQVTIGTATSVAINVTATVSHTAGTSMASLQEQIEDAIESYLSEVRVGWGVPESGDITVYVTSVFISRVTAAILGVPGVINVTGVTLNSASADVYLTETAALQQTPILGTVTITEA